MRFWRRLMFIFKFHRSIPFFKDFFISNEITIGKKLISILLIVGYIIFPFDAIPDFLLFFGVLDDVMVATLILQQIVKMAPASLKEKYKVSLP